MTEEVAVRPNNRVTRIVSDEFKFLTEEDDEDIDVNEKDSHKNEVTNTDNLHSLNNGFKDDCGKKEVNDELNNKINKEFTLVTSILNGMSDSNQNVVLETSAKDSGNDLTNVNITDGDGKKIEGLYALNINPVYEVSEEDSLSLIKSDLIANSNTHKNDKLVDDVNEMEVNSRSSVIVEGEVVELRKSPASDASRQSKVATWRRNQQFVSEAFGFLKDIEYDEDKPIADFNGIAENNVECSGAENLVSKIHVHEVNTLPSNSDENKPTESDDSVCLCNKSDNDDKLAENTLDDVATALCENDSLGDLPNRPRRKKLSHQSSTENGDDDGGSSDEDAGMYRESFRKSTWLYVGDNEEIKIGQNQSNYVSIADLGLKTCEDDDVFGTSESEVPVSPLKKIGHQRSDSTATTLSEQEFRSQFKSVSRRFVKRADSQQEYKRFTVKCYDNVKVVTLERDADVEYGIHILDSKPAVISRVDAGSPSEVAGLRQGHIVTSINGVNVLEADHDEIIRLVQQDSKTLTIEVGYGDMSAVLDLQVPVHTGYLQKQVSSTIFRTWKKRFFILRRDNCLYYYKHDKEVDPLGAIPLSGYTFSRHGDHNKFGFKAEKYNSKTFYFLADSRDNMTSWVGALNKAAQDVRDKNSWMDVTASNVGLPALNIRNPDCSGYLYKMGRATRRWRKRYCVLKDACIYYYKNANSKEADGVAHLHGYVVDPSGVSSKKNSFSLQPPEVQMRVFSFYADNDTDKLRWVRSLSASIKKWVKVD